MRKWFLNMHEVVIPVGYPSPLHEIWLKILFKTQQAKAAYDTSYNLSFQSTQRLKCWKEKLSKHTVHQTAISKWKPSTETSNACRLHSSEDMVTNYIIQKVPKITNNMNFLSVNINPILTFPWCTSSHCASTRLLK